MLPVFLDLSKSLMIEINKNVSQIMDDFIFACEGLDYETFLAEIFPLFCLQENPSRCKKILFELKDMACDSFQRDYLQPIYEYALFYLLEWWLEVSEVDMDSQIPDNEIRTEDDKYLSQRINDIEEYKNVLFQDWDFLYVSEYVDSYSVNPKLLKLFDIDLEDYTELMPPDIRKDFLRLSQQPSFAFEIPASNYEEYIIKSIYNTIRLMERLPREIETLSEPELSNRIQCSLAQLFAEKGIIIERESPGGFSLKQTGELDFYIYKYADGLLHTIAVGENKEWEGFEDSIEQVIGYMDSNILFGFTIIFNKTTKLSTVLDRRKEILGSLGATGDFEVIGDIEDVVGMTHVIKTKHQNPEEEDSYFCLYHFIINTCLPERKQAAKNARKKSVTSQ